ncbi:hypothetical protein SAMN05192557_0417 [Aliicoccus persicus]|uniref:Uncharacterized protein n=1 Tax=Aliicoccus persicus TaxID=930138 RepID=A0A662Z1G8_9STAP|nr:hypothetical protein SAMN05192557_0417 [Aliicoccus persicus]
MYSIFNFNHIILNVILSKIHNRLEDTENFK